MLQWECPGEVLHKKPPTYDHLRIVGCLSFALLRQSTKGKFASKSRRCIFPGYPLGHKGYKLYDLDDQRVIYSRDVIFQETIFPFLQKSPIQPSMPILPLTSFEHVPVHDGASHTPISTSSPLQQHSSTNDSPISVTRGAVPCSSSEPNSDSPSRIAPIRRTARDSEDVD